MNQHRGQHPRIGAADVLPFVPLAGSTLEHCVALARAVGRRIGEELGIPVYLYEAAATRPDRIALPNLRRGEYEGLREAIERDPERAPDFGPARLGPAGATVVGARMPLIAFNIYLNSADVQIAKRVAKAVRGSSGGLRGVRALGLLVDGRAQVSMNLIDYQGTPLHRVFELVAREAAAYGVSIVESELVGLIPEDALIDTARHYLRLHSMHKDQILERRLAQATADDQRLTTDSHQPSLVVGRWSLVDSEQERAMESDLQQTIAALGSAAGQLAESVPGEARSVLMLQALGRELRELAAQPAQASPRAIARAMLLAAERAAKVAEVAAGLDETSDQQIQTAATSAIQMAQALAADAQARATALLPQLADQELRDNFAHEFAAHARQTEALAARLGPAT
jgi:glutamate formiminotransferase